MKPTKLEIIQRLLDDRRINAEEAMILMEKEKEYIYLPSYPTNPYPWNPIVTWNGFPSSYSTSDSLIINN